MKKLLFLAAFAASVSLVHATNYTLIDDTFDRTGNLNGSAPTFSSIPETWTATSTTPATSIQTVTTGSGEASIPATVQGVTASNGNPAANFAYLAIPGLTGGNLNLNVTYTLSFTIDYSSGRGWIAAGFGTMGNTTNVPYEGYNSAGYWVFDNGTGENFDSNTTLAGQETASGTYTNTTDASLAAGGVQNIVMTIDETSLHTYTLTAKDGTTNVYSSTTVTSLTPIADVFLGGYEATGYIQNFELTETPEPGSWALIGLGAAVLGWQLRSRSATLRA